MTRSEAIQACRLRTSYFVKMVAPVYALLEWFWGMGSKAIVPGYKDILQTSTRLLNNIDDEEGDCNWSTGGLTAEVWNDPVRGQPENWTCTLSFTFQVASYDEDDE
jgi:hypothetical protein